MTAVALLENQRQACSRTTSHAALPFATAEKDTEDVVGQALVVVFGHHASALAHQTDGSRLAASTTDGISSRSSSLPGPTNVMVSTSPTVR